MNTEQAVVLGGLAVVAAVAYAWKWRKNYVLNMAERKIRSSIPTDVVGGADISLDDIGEFDGIAEFTCLQPCCYTPIDEPLEIWIDPDDE